MPVRYNRHHFILENPNAPPTARSSLYNYGLDTYALARYSTILQRLSTLLTNNNSLRRND